MGRMFWRSAIYLNSSSKLNTYQVDDLLQPAGAAICGLIYWWYVRGRYADIAAWPSHHQLASISGSQYLLYLLSDDLLPPISTLPSLAPAPAILTHISRASLVPAIDLADILPRCCNHNVGGNIKRKESDKWPLLLLLESLLSWLFDEYFKSPCLFPLTLVTMSDPHSNLIAAQPTTDRVLISLSQWSHHITILSME